MVSLVVFLDLSAAFDTIDHAILLDRLYYDYGIRGTALKWMKSYLTKRYQTVHINQLKSDAHELRFGVPQGSVLGPIVFIMYTKALRKIAARHGLKIHLYADDTQLYVSFTFSNQEEAMSAMDRVIACISEIKLWMSQNKLQLNDEKNEYLIVASPSHLSHLSLPPLKIGETVIHPSNSAKNLGVIFDSNLNMNEHINQLCKKAYFHLRNISNIRKSLSKINTEQLVHAFVTSQLDNCNALLYGLPVSSTQKLQRVMNAAARIICMKRKFDHITPTLVDLHWLPVKQRILYKILLLTYKAQNGLAPSYIQELITPYQPGRALRSQQLGLLSIPRTKLKTYGGRSFAKAAPTLWNSLPLSIRMCETLPVFKRTLKTHLFQLWLNETVH